MLLKTEKNEKATETTQTSQWWFGNDIGNIELGDLWCSNWNNFILTSLQEKFVDKSSRWSAMETEKEGTHYLRIFATEGTVEMHHI